MNKSCFEWRALIDTDFAKRVGDAMLHYKLPSRFRSVGDATFGFPSTASSPWNK